MGRRMHLLSNLQKRDSVRLLSSVVYGVFCSSARRVTRRTRDETVFVSFGFLTVTRPPGRDLNRCTFREDLHQSIYTYTAGLSLGIYN